MEEERPLEVVTPEGEVLDREAIEFAYTREGRRVIGKEFPNPVPMEPPLGYIQQEPLHEQIRRMVMNDLSRRAAEAEAESFEDADDFDVGDDYDPSTPYEIDFEPTNPWPGSRDVNKAEEEAAAQAEKSGGAGGPSPPAESPPSEAAKPPPTPSS